MQTSFCISYTSVSMDKKGFQYIQFLLHDCFHKETQQYSDCHVRCSSQVHPRITYFNKTTVAIVTTSLYIRTSVLRRTDIGGSRVCGRKYKSS